ncbi:MmyB family transcriptional regulator [Microlunatus endophyticus]|nr:hypothetical protein [Microlunatus endophyticus]
MPDTVREFLASRRTAIEPADVGLPPSPVPRRGKGLEQGRAGQVSDQVLTAIEDALRLDDYERQHLRALVEPRRARPRPARPEKIRVRAGLRTLIAAMDPTPAILQGPRFEVLAWNRADAALLTDFGAMLFADRNIARTGSSSPPIP